VRSYARRSRYRGATQVNAIVLDPGSFAMEGAPVIARSTPGKISTVLTTEVSKALRCASTERISALHALVLFGLRGVREG
jgi:hypothetical protein